MKLLTWLNRILLAFYVSISILAITGHIAFGHGLGDLVNLILLWAVSLVFIWFFIYKKNANFPVLLIFTLFFAFFLGYQIYLMTIGRGPEYPWNGKILYHSFM